jgi:hypothetical protein
LVHLILHLASLYVLELMGCKQITTTKLASLSEQCYIRK